MRSQGLKGRHRALVEELQRRGWVNEGITGSGHVKLRHVASGRHIIVSKSPSDGRGYYNLRAHVRRIERSVPT